MGKVGKVTKTSNITVFLFGKPAWEMNLEHQDVDYEMVQALENLGNELNERLRYLSGLTRKLLDSGWTGQGGLYDISYYKDQSIDETTKELTELGMDPRGMDISEEDWPDGEECIENRAQGE